MSRWLRTLIATLVCGAVCVVGCGGDDSGDGGASAPQLVVFAASSLGPAFERYGDEFTDADVKFSFAGSDDLAAQIRQGVTPDVYAAANTTYPDDLAKDGFLEQPQTFVTNELVVGVPAGSEIDDVSDLEQAGRTVAIGDEGVPVGDYAREVLAGLGAGPSQAILENVATAEPDVAGIVGKLTQGAVDAGFVYQSDVDASSGRLEAVELPDDVSPDVAYGIAVGADAAEPELAREFVDGAVEGEGQDILIESGFGPPPR
jgi:molybdate transport system substrate-binding protein